MDDQAARRKVGKIIEPAVTPLPQATKQEEIKPIEQAKANIAKTQEIIKDMKKLNAAVDQQRARVEMKHKAEQYENIKQVAGLTPDCYNHGFDSGAMAQEMIRYACHISDFDRDFILTLNSENGSWNYQQQSNVHTTHYKTAYTATGLAYQVSYKVREPSFGMCQMHHSFQKDEVYEGLPLSKVKESRFLTDWKYQLEICYDAYKRGVPMYGFKDRYIRAAGKITIAGVRY